MFLPAALEDTQSLPWVSSHINASIIVQLLGVVIPKFEEWSKEGRKDRKLQQVVRYGAIVLALLQATGMTLGIFRQAVLEPGIFTYLTIIVAPSSLYSFPHVVREIITEKG